MEMIIEQPSRILLPSDSDEVKAFLTYTDRGVQFLLKKHSESIYWKRSNPEAWQNRRDDLKSQQIKSLLFYDEQGRPYTYSGLWKALQDRFHWSIDRTKLESFESKLIPWAHKLEFAPYYYQDEAFQALLEAGHGSIELPTGAGKSFILFMLAHHYGVKTVIVTPSISVTMQLYKQFVYYFGAKYVGMIGGGKKTTNKLFTLAVAKSLTQLTDGDHYDNIASCKVLIWDESHTTPAETFDQVCMGVAKNAIKRFFVSATQTRTDGSEMKLKGIIGPVVYRREFKELADKEFLAKPKVKIFKVSHTMGANNKDAKKETRNQLYMNPHVNALAGQITTKFVRILNQQVVILIEEFKQFMILRNHLQVPYEFVHGPVDATTKEFLPKEYWNSDTEGAVDRFNKGECRVLIGTTAISTGVDIKPVNCLIYMQGGTSEIKVKQGLGRGTRPVKPSFWFIDFMIKGSATMERHCNTRIKYYEQLSDDIEIIGN